MRQEEPSDSWGFDYSDCYIMFLAFGQYQRNKVIVYGICMRPKPAVIPDSFWHYFQPNFLADKLAVETRDYRPTKVDDLPYLKVPVKPLNFSETASELSEFQRQLSAVPEAILSLVCFGYDSPDPNWRKEPICCAWWSDTLEAKTRTTIAVMSNSGWS